MVGIREHGNNRGREVERIIAIGGGRPGDSWCMYTVYAAYSAAAKKTGVRNPLLRTGACWQQLRHAMRHRGDFTVMYPSMYLGIMPTVAPGDIAIYARSNNSDAAPGRQFLGHTGTITADHGTTFEVIEGNTSCTTAGSQHNGDAVCRKRRRKVGGHLPVIAFIRVKAQEVTS